jgi:hypothetical protein
MSTSAGDALVRRWVGRRAGEELERLRREKMRSIDTREAVRRYPEALCPPFRRRRRRGWWSSRRGSPRFTERWRSALADKLKHVARA